ncbi:protein kinase [Streptomyces sp. NPDC092369]|uniref:serine/threonine-protein kinase n=1 Tax=Streptomyces sp. NPDC092369 TaxID=3366015 RepID=UPI00382DE50E
MSAGGERTREGRLLGGRYRLTERIGSGGMGTVWRAYDELVGRDVAVKQPRLPGDPEDEHRQRAAHRLYREARAAARVEHPAAVSIHDVVVEEDGLPWIVMELVRGESLHELLRRGPVDAAEAARIGHAVLGALQAAHSVGIVHRDVKPANVLLGTHGRVVLTDFGIAHVQGEESLTMSGEFIGSLEFVAPERMSGRGAGPASDLWALGVVLFAAVEGWSPFRRTTVESTLAAVIASDPPEPEQAGPLGSLITRLLAKDPEQRPGAEEASAILEAVAEGRPVPVHSAAEVTDIQDASLLREFKDDAGTVRLGAGSASRVPAGASAAASDVTAGGGRDAERLPGSGDANGSANDPGSELAPDPDAGLDSDAGLDPDTGPDFEDTPPDEDSPRAGNPLPAEPVTQTVSPPDTRLRTPSRRSPLRHPALLGTAGVLLLGGALLGVPHFTASDDGSVRASSAHSSAPAASRSAAPAPSPSATNSWIAHREPDLDAVLSLPAEYKEAAREGSATDQPRLVVYDIGLVQVRLTLWDKAPGTVLERAQKVYNIWNGYAHDASGGGTRTVYQGLDAVLSDITYDKDESPTRVIQLIVATADDRMYELRVDMPKGTPSEKKGTAVFEGAKDRLVIAKS